MATFTEAASLEAERLSAKLSPQLPLTWFVSIPITIAEQLREQHAGCLFVAFRSSCYPSSTPSPFTIATIGHTHGLTYSSLSFVSSFSLQTYSLKSSAQA
ncbi:hypothetical protein SeLEV6574_g08100 [Synchytrium endobioticum]|uniref:Uncharacterized protein n=1 Tax=Synchytrium endobioticum TaxID=286115 RepID=A0A507CES8_9FUNG|nr:hypothetical protein SeLEV6574_g08100 [Synchytrium endobioticum]